MTYDPHQQQPAYPPTSGQPVSPGVYPPPQPPPKPGNDGKRFLNMSGGVLALSIAGVLLLCCVGPLVLCLVGGVFGSITDAAKPDPTVEITACRVDSATRTATIEYTIKNNSGSEDSYSIDFEVTDDAGIRVGDGYDFASSVGAGTTAKGDVLVVLDSAGGSKCRVKAVR